MSEPTTHQREQLDIATSARVGILTGAAGTGKSFVTAHYLKSLQGGYRVAAPTGKAAARLQHEGIPATTIHSMLVPGRNGHDREGWGFLYNESMPLPCSHLIVDEAFMLGTELMRDLLAAVKTGTRILFCGDPNQLAPVGHGRPVLDMLESGVVPHGHLSEIHRFAGRIARVANAIKDGKRWQPSPQLDLDAVPPENLRHVEAASPAQILNTLPQVIERMRERGFDPIEDVQVVCGLNDKGRLNRKVLNSGLQAILNPDGRRDENGKVPFRVGDKVICLRNHLRKAIDSPPDDEDFDADNTKVYIANGELGRVTGLLTTKAGKCSGIEARFCGRLVEVKADGLKDFDLAYAVTCHKMQGSQSSVVIVVVDDGAAQVASRSWHYTAITRAADVCITLGKRATIAQQCQRVDIISRKTFLTERIQEWHSRRKYRDADIELDSLLETL